MAYKILEQVTCNLNKELILLLKKRNKQNKKTPLLSEELSQQLRAVDILIEDMGFISSNPCQLATLCKSSARGSGNLF